MAWHAKEVVRSIYEIPAPVIADQFVAQLGQDLQDDSCPPEVHSLGRTITRWKDQITAWHRARVSNGPTEAVNNLVKRIKRVAFGITNFRNYRIRALLYAGKPNWDLLASITPHVTAESHQCRGVRDRLLHVGARDRSRVCVRTSPRRLIRAGPRQT